MSLYESVKHNFSEADTVNAEDIINPEDKDYADGHLMKVCLWPGAGYDLGEFYVYVRGDDAQTALDKVVAYCEQNEYTGFILPTNEVEDFAEKDYAEELANYDGDLDEFITNYLNYVYVDATMEGASQPYYVYGENLRIENVEEPINEAEEDEEDNSGDMEELKSRIQEMANSGDALVQDVLEDQLDYVDDYDTPQDFLEHLTELYITGGGVSSMIYYDDTLKFLDGHSDEINERLKEKMDEYGTHDLKEFFGNGYDADDPLNIGTSNRNLFAWWAYEDVCRDAAYELNEKYNYDANI